MPLFILRLFLIFIVLIFEVSVALLFSGAYQAPSALLGLVCAWTLRRKFSSTLWWIVVSGLLLDIFTFKPVGSSVAVFVFTGYFVGFLSRRFLVRQPFWGNISIVGILFLSTAIYNILRIGFLFMESGQARIADLLRFSLQPSTLKSFFLCFTLNSMLFLLLRFLVEKKESFASRYEKTVRPKHHW